MDKRKFLLQIIRGQEPKRRYIKLYEYQAMTNGTGFPRNTV